MGNCVHYIGTVCLDLQRKLNVQNSKNSTGNCIHYICKEWLDLPKNWMSSTAKIERGILYIICPKCRDLKKNWISRTSKIQREIVYIIYVRPFQIYRKIESPKQRKFSLKLCTIHVQNVWIAEKLNIQNYVNSTENCVRYICTKCLDLQKIWLSRTS